MRFTEAEKNHLLHVVKENAGLTRGPAITWCRENGIEYHELVPALVALSEEMKAGNAEGIEPTAEWVPPASSGEEFRKRIAELTAP
jgi:hypothetical protein